MVLLVCRVRQIPLPALDGTGHRLRSVEDPSRLWQRHRARAKNHYSLGPGRCQAGIGILCV